MSNFQFILLSSDQLIQLIRKENINSVFGEIDYKCLNISNDLIELIHYFYLPNLADSSQNPIFYSFYLVFHTGLKTIVGDIGFKGIPNVNNEIEVGYSVYSKFRNKKFMTNILIDFCIFNQDLLKNHTLIAYTDKDNIASQKVLFNNGFGLDSEDEFHYKYIKN